MFTSSILCLTVVASICRVTYAHNGSLPIVDLGYQLHQASSFNETGNFYNFSNIRYARPPTGALRFAPPQVPEPNRSSVQTGDIGRICPQAKPGWTDDAVSLLTNILSDHPSNDTEPYTPQTVNALTDLPSQDPRVSEDCLFLDIFVPRNILESAGKGYGAPVLVWFYGGGYTSGDKYRNPAGLLAASGNVTNGEIIYVSLNYRLGALGWSSGPSYQAEGGVANLGLLDQRFALNWIQDNIAKFGGDKNRVTVLGESAGGGSIIHQIIAYGGAKGPAPFQQAIPQSPGWDPVTSQLQQEDTYQFLLNLTNSTTLADLRAVSEEDIIRASTLQVLSTPYGGFAYGPVVDGIIVPAQPGQLLAQGRFDQNVRVMVGHNAREGPYFTAATINSTEDLLQQLRGNFPYLPEKSLKHINEDLYPAIFDGTYPYTTEFERAELIITEVVFTCNTFYLASGFKERAYSYLFSPPPAFHAVDVPYTYYTGGAVNASNPLVVQNRTLAIALQHFITSFAKNGVPEAEGIRPFNIYGANATVLNLNLTSIEEITDNNANRRCKWWQKGLYT